MDVPDLQRAPLAELARGLAHAIRNSLAGISGVLDVMEKELPATSASRPMIGDVQAEFIKIQAILDDFVAYATPSTGDFQVVDLASTVQRAILVARRRAPSQSGTIVFRETRSVLPVEHDPMLIETALTQVLLHRLTRIPTTGEIRIAIEPSLKAAKVVITDTGAAPTGADISNAFQPFFKPRDRDTGLELPLAKKIVGAHNGQIILASQPGPETRFEILLPLEQKTGSRPIVAD